jgi:nitrite reductase/ring-hydroxylating ferredoxin subunit
MSRPPEEFDTGIELHALDPERPRIVETPWGTMALYRVDAEVFCSQAFCPHLEGPLFQGTLSGPTITCPWHQWRYDLRTGARIDPARPRSGPGSEHLARCGVSRSARGTLVLRLESPTG